MGIFDNLFKNKEEVVAPVVNENIDIYDKIKTLIKENKEVNQLHMTKLIHNDIKREYLFNIHLFGERVLAGVGKAIEIRENKEDPINFVLKIPLEYRPFKDYGYESDVDKRFKKTMNNEFLVIKDITEEQKVKLNNMLDGFKDKLGTEWLLSFVDFIKEIDNMNLNKRDIKDKTFSPNLEGNVFKSEQTRMNAFRILEDATTLYIGGTQLNTTIEDKFNKGDYIIEDNFGKFINVSKEDFEAKYKVIEKESIEKESFDNIIDETKKVLTDKSNEYNGLKKELESAKVEIERLREKLNGIENNFKNLS